MFNFLNTFAGWFGFGGALGERRGDQLTVPAAALVEGISNLGPDGALQISAVWSCIERRATTIASLPFFAYEFKAANSNEKDIARGSRLYSLLHESPNGRMTPFEFWRAMMMNHDLRGNGYARIDRDASGEAISMWPMPADQVQPFVLDDGSMVYVYRIDDDVAVLDEANVLHLKNLGNGTIGLAKLDFMRATNHELATAQTNASKLFGAAGKPTGVLMVDNTLTPVQREALKRNFAEMAMGSTARLFVLEANMKYQQLSLSPEDQQLLETRRFGIEEVCRWFDVPPVLAHHSNVTTWGSGIEQIVDGFYKLTIRPMLVNIEQAVRKRVMTARQRARMTVEFNLDALLRGNAKDRYEVYAKAIQNSVKTPNECRQLENDPPIPGGDVLMVQSNMMPIDQLGQAPAASPAPSPAQTRADLAAVFSHEFRVLRDEIKRANPPRVEMTLHQQPVHVEVAPPAMNFTLPPELGKTTRVVKHERDPATGLITHSTVTETKEG